MATLADQYGAQMDSLYENYHQRCIAITQEVASKLKSESITTDEVKNILGSQADNLDAAYADFNTRITLLRQQFLKDKEAAALAGEQEDLLNLEETLNRV